MFRHLILGLGLGLLPASQAVSQGLDLGMWPSQGASVATTYMVAPAIISIAQTTISATRYMGLANTAPSVFNVGATENLVQTPSAVAMSLTGLQVNTTAGVTSGSWTITVRDAGASPTGGISCTISTTAPTNSCTDFYPAFNHHTEVVAGDLIDVLLSGSSPLPVNGFGVSFMMRSTSGQALPLFFGTGAAISVASGTNVSFMQGQSASVVFPVNGHIDNMYVQASGSVGTITTTPAQCASACVPIVAFYGACGSEVVTNLSANILSGQASANDTNAAHGFDVQAGNCMYMQSAGQAGGSSSVWVNGSVRWSPGGGGLNYYYPIFTVGTTLPASATNKWCSGFSGPLCYNNNVTPLFPDTTDSNNVVRSMTAQNIYVNTDVAPTGNRTWSIVASGSATTGAINCVQSSTTACNSGTVPTALSTGTPYNILAGSTATSVNPVHFRVGYGMTVE